MKLVFATNNKNKLHEVQLLLPKSIQVLSLKDINCTEDIAETGTTLQENAHIKADYITKKYQVDCFADDTGLEVLALDGEPGVYSARYAGNENDSVKNMEKLLHNLKDKADRSAQFRTVIALNIRGVKHEFEGVCKGKIANKFTGDKGFGYDPIFIPDGYEKSFAEMTTKEKSAISHRGKAIASLVKFLENQE